MSLPFLSHNKFDEKLSNLHDICYTMNQLARIRFSKMEIDIYNYK